MDEKEISRYKNRPECFKYNHLRKELLEKKSNKFLCLAVLVVLVLATVLSLSWLPSVTATRIDVVLNATELAAQNLTQREALLLISEQQATFSANIFLGSIFLLLTWYLTLTCLSEYCELEKEFEKKFR